MVLLFGADDLARVRFAVSPLVELIGSLRLLRDPALAAMHVPWVREALPAARGLDLQDAFALTPVPGPVPEYFMPDFLTPPPITPVATLEQELARMLATPAEQVRAEIARVVGPGTPGPALQAIAADPTAGLARLAAALRRYWDAAIRAHWPRMRDLLDADLQHRAARLTTGGAEALFGDLHPTIGWAQRRLELELRSQDDVELGGRGVVLVPSIFFWQRPMAVIEPPWQPTVAYPARGLGLLWEPAEPSSQEALVGVLGRTRAALLALLAAPRTTTELAARLALAPSGVSRHLGALARAGLVCARRDGREVLYVRTAAAEALLGSDDSL